MIEILDRKGNDYEVKFQEIEICIFHEIKITIMRLQFSFFMRLNLSIICYNFDQDVNTSIMRSTLKKALLANFDLMIAIVTNKSIMKLKKALLANFDLMSNAKFCQSHDRKII